MTDKKSSFLSIELNYRITNEEIVELEKALHDVAARQHSHGEVAVSNLQYKKGVYFE